MVNEYLDEPTSEQDGTESEDFVPIGAALFLLAASIMFFSKPWLGALVLAVGAGIVATWRVSEKQQQTSQATKLQNPEA